MHMDMVKNIIGGTVNSFLAQEAVTPTEMRYILKSILSEVAELEATRQNLSSVNQSDQKQEELNVKN